MTGSRMALAAALALAVAGCGGRAPIDTGDSFSGTPGAGGFGADGFGGGAVTGGTLPGTSIGDTVMFAVDQTTLSPTAIGTIEAQVGWLNANAGRIEIEGYADERGTEQYNIQLGARRAAAVRDYMVSRGIPDARISTNTFGRARPVATCADESCWSQNRRAVTVVTGAPGV